MAIYLPDELAVLFLRRGELVNAIALTEERRAVVPIASVLQQIRQEAERGELLFCEAPVEQLAWMVASCASPASPRMIDPARPKEFLPAIQHEQFSGVLEFIVDGRVSYLRFQDGAFLSGYFHGADDVGLDVRMERWMAPGADGSAPALAAAAFQAPPDLPVQAAPALIAIYREVYWAIARAADGQAPDARKRAERLREALSGVHLPLTVLGTPLDRDAPDLVASPHDLANALADWTLQFLEELEVLAPGIAPVVLKEAAREHRFVLQKAGFFAGLPWNVEW